MLHDSAVLEDQALVAEPACCLFGAAQNSTDLGRPLELLSRRYGKDGVVQAQPSQQLPKLRAAYVVLPFLTGSVSCLRMTRSWMTRSGC